eukprot:10575604-Karenia_brevis.AAC.1
MDGLLHAAWMLAFQMYVDTAEPSWELFPKKISKIHQKLTGLELRHLVSNMRYGASTGIDAWRVADSKALPDMFMNILADLLSTVEETGRWPTGLQRTASKLIGKRLGAKPMELRPICIMSLIYRSWASR